MLKRTVLHTILMMVLIGSPMTGAGPARDALMRFFDQTQTLDARFVQVVYDERGRPVQKATGRVTLSRPGQVRWEYLSPDPQLILVDGRHLWIYDEALEQVTVKPVKEALGTAPIMLLTEARGLTDEYSISERDANTVELRPRVKDSEFVRIDFGFRDGRVEQMVLHDQFGQRTLVRFEDARVNEALPPETFRFTVPPEVDVIGNPGATSD